MGANLEGLVLYLHYAHPLGYQRVQRILDEMCGLPLGIGTLVNCVKRGQSVLAEGAGAIRERIQHAHVVGSDETGARVNGVNYWQWVFQTPDYAYYVLRPSRAAQVITDVMVDAQPQVWVSDVLSSQMCHPAQAYQIRDLQYLIDRQQCAWAEQIQRLFRKAIHLHNLRDSLSTRRFDLLKQAYEWRLDKLLALPPPSEDSQRLWQRFHKHRSALLLFLARDDVPPTNNASEQALRNSVIYRKVIGGFRTDWGADLYADLLSILETARRQRLSVFDVLSSIFTPSPQFSWLRE
jgi:transposase